MLRSNNLEVNELNKEDGAHPLHDRGELLLLPFPGENTLRHEERNWLESAEARFAAKGLLTVANGGEYAAAR